MSRVDDIQKDPYLKGVYSWLQQEYESEKLARFLTVRIAGAIRKLRAECIDNLRVADKSNLSQMKEYQDAIAGGC